MVDPGLDTAPMIEYVNSLEAECSKRGESDIAHDLRGIAAQIKKQDWRDVFEVIDFAETILTEERKV